ncbi:DUF262 domain-containing protein [Microbacterium sp. BLY]|uniref:DUF262 domain-containing protein n=1 Tax=Microbacterium sp. BLY TaxID=2823280 RepID=UPI001B337EFD|nr:DUF262 domain-containing protein [Microbacterium sp. BLY]MBP3977128.1 DUF262 domain-containing protein [Microbacterium sp. BLY]
MAPKITTTTKDVGLLKQLYDDGQLQLSPEFQRNAIWPRPAKAYLIDTILTGNPIPVLYFQRSVSAQTGRIEYTVVDGQQRLSAVMDFLANRFSLTESEDQPWSRLRWKGLSAEDRSKVLEYDFVIQELSGFSPASIRAMFARMNRFVVALNPQERRHAGEDGEFKKLAESVGRWSHWKRMGVVSTQAAKRMKSDELAAELLILIQEGPQDKKQSIDLYYDAYSADFPDGDALEARLLGYVELVERALPEIKHLFVKRPANFYALIGALSEIEQDGEPLPSDDQVRERLTRFDAELRDEDEVSQRKAAYEMAQSRQTDNIKPRRTRIDILRQILTGQI